MKFPFSFALNILLFVLLSSCEDNPVIHKDTPYQFDSARYDWKVDTLPDYVLDIWGIDSSAIYFLSINHLLKLEGGNYQVIFFGAGFAPESFGGVNGQNLLIGGKDDNFDYRPRLLKYDGSSFNQIPIADSSKQYYVSWVYAYNENEIWLGTNKGRLLMYDGNNIKYFLYDTNYQIRPLLKTSSNDFYVYADNWYHWFEHGGDLMYKVFNFSREKWNLLYSELNPSNTLVPYRINNELISCGKDGIYRFGSIDFSKIIDISVLFQGVWFDGSSEEDLLFFGVTSNPYRISPFHWNGTKWSREISFYESPSTMMIRKIQNKYIALFGQGENTRLICYGTRK